jgi:NadR type nicotinamide-nucleotide adenylyltransferase
MEQKKIKKVVIIGPESTGKSTLCENLAAHFKTIWVKEYAREYLLKNGTDYSFENLFEIATGQLHGEDEAIKNLNNDCEIVFIDTDMYVMKVWSEFVFNKCDNRILNEILKREYDLYLLCNTDLPWAKDELREYPDNATREKLFLFYKEEMTEQQTPWVIINGIGEERLRNAIDAVEKIIE